MTASWLCSWPHSQYEHFRWYDVRLRSLRILSISSRFTPPVVLYHYTTQRGLLGIINCQQIWATHHQYLNDFREFVHAKEMSRCEIQKQAAPRDVTRIQHTLDGKGFEDVSIFVASFSEDPDSLSQWRAYGGPTSGFSLGFRAGQMILPPRLTIVKCIYEEDEQRKVIEALVTEVLNRLRRVPGRVDQGPYVDVFIRNALHQYALVLKHPKFKEEREWRIISAGRRSGTAAQAPLG